MHSFYKIVFCFSCIYFNCINIFGQSESKAILVDFDIGFQSVRAQDLIFSEMIYRGTSIGSINLGMNINTARSLFKININHATSKLSPNNLIYTPSFGQRSRSTYTGLAMDISYSRQLPIEMKARMYAGAFLKTAYQQTALIFGLGNELSYLYSNTTGPIFSVTCKLPADIELNSYFSLPIFAYVIRPEYAIVDNEFIQRTSGLNVFFSKGKFVTLDKYFAPKLKFSFTKELSSSFRLNFNYYLDYQRVLVPETINILRTAFSLGPSLKLS